MFKAIKAFFSADVPVVETVQKTIEKIHNEFDTAGEKLLAEAKQILSREDDTSKGDRLKSLGFAKCAAVETASKIKLEKAQSQETAELVQYYQQWYPNYKFITESIVKQICEKYGLVCGEVGMYKGDVPEKNISEIESFKLRDEDKIKQTNFDDYRDNMLRNALMNQRSLGFSGFYQTTYSPDPPSQITERLIQPIFTICAPEKDFDMKYMSKIGYKLIPDPIVLQPVKGGYLIVSKWGLEASDEGLVNQKMN